MPNASHFKMNTTTFFNHYGILDNPFRAEEARQDAIFARIETVCHHPDYPKIRGEFDRPSSAIVFGERGSGKTAIRIQIQDDLAEHNRASPGAKCLGIAYDELNPVLDRLHQQLRLRSADESLARMNLTDHVDGILASVVPSVVDQAVGEHHDQPVIEIENSLRKRLRGLEPAAKRDLLLLQVCYDRPDDADLRTRRLRSAIKARSLNILPLMKWGAAVLGLVTIGLILYVLFADPQEYRWLWLTAIIVPGIAALGLIGRWGWLWWKVHRLARSLSASLRVLHRPALSFRKSLTALNIHDIRTAELPIGSHDDPRYAMIQRLLRVLRPLGYRSIIVFFDRIDEPTLINGEPSRMRSVVWPMMNNKFLQQDNFGIKMLLPLDLKHLLFRESQEFFREARLDKQNLIDRLTWSGAMLYDLCTARLNACREPDAEPLSLTGIFEENVTQQELVDALDQMQQPRDAFKLLYRVIQEHCANVPEERPVWKIPKLTLDAVRKDQVDRLSGMLRGVRPG